MRIVIGVFALEVDIIEHDADDMDAGILEALHGFAGVFAADFVEFRHKHHAV